MHEHTQNRNHLQDVPFSPAQVNIPVSTSLTDLEEFWKKKQNNCTRYPSLKFLNRRTGEMCHFNCNTYRCPECRERKKRRLIYYVRQYFEAKSEVWRLWTFTISSSYFRPNPEGRKLHYLVLQDAWHILFKEVRRCVVLSDKQRNVQYFRVNELHRTGFVHIHALFDQYIHFSQMEKLWHYAVTLSLRRHGVAFDESRKICNANITKSRRKNAEYTAGGAAQYILTYVTKYVTDPRTQNLNMRMYSVSQNARIFPEKISSGEWQVVRISADGMLLSPLAITCPTLVGIEQLPEGLTDGLFKHEDIPIIEVCTKPDNATMDTLQELLQTFLE